MKLCQNAALSCFKWEKNIIKTFFSIPWKNKTWKKKKGWGLRTTFKYVYCLFKFILCSIQHKVN